jgi:hypothetical protein
MAPTAAFGAEDAAAALPAPSASASHGLVLCELAATPEAETHGRFCERLAAQMPAGAVLALGIDETSFRRRFASIPERLEQRRKAWSAYAERLEAAPVFLDFDAAPGESAVDALHQAFARPVRGGLGVGGEATGDGRAIGRRVSRA